MSDTQPQLVGGRYQLGELLGRGGMAEVRKGTDTRLGRVVAIKRLRTDLASDATFQARFRREAQSAASLNHPAVVAVYDTGEEPAADGSGVSQPYIVMEYVAGRTLRDILREGRKILPQRALEISSGVLSALDYSHRAGIIHRDIKPGNVMLTPTGDVKVMDFGIARAISDASSTVTQTAAVVGTAQYLSPEQARGETVDSRSDVYSAGCLLYELLTGRPPFVGDSPVAVAYQHVREPAVPPSQHEPELAPEIDAIVMTALAKRVEDRYQSAAQMRGDIERYLAGHPVHAGPPPPPPPPPTGATAVVAAVPAAASTGARALPVAHDDDPRRRAGLWWALGVLLLALLIAGAVLLPRLFEQPPDQRQVPAVIGIDVDAARTAIGEAGLTVGNIDYRPDPTAKAGRVVEQDPAADSFVDPGTKVDLVVSQGKPQVTVPPVVGLSREVAAQRLRDAGLRVAQQETESDAPAGQVVDSDPAEGAKVAEGLIVTLTYSDGPEQVPDVVGLSKPQAEAAIRGAGFQPRTVTSNDTTAPKGTVIDQSPSAGETLPQGSTVTIVVSSFEKPSPSPTEPPPTTTPPPTTPTTPPPTTPPAVVTPPVPTPSGSAAAPGRRVNPAVRRS